MAKMIADNLAIEVTRNCNLSCAHCLRGEPESKRMAKKTLCTGLSVFDRINTIVFTGGEPTLNLTAIENALEICKELRVSVGNFYIVTNGKMDHRTLLRLIRVCNKWYDYCDDNELSALTMSRDKFHEQQLDTYYQLLDRDLPYFSPEDKHTDWKRATLIRTGRAESLSGYSMRKAESASDWSQIEAERYGNGVIGLVDGVLYYSCDGLFYPSCDLSYDQIHKARGLTPDELKAYFAERVKEAG